jgi:hypothetical protein
MVSPLFYKHLVKKALSVFTTTAGRCGKKLWDFELWGRERRAYAIRPYRRDGFPLSRE